MSRRKGADKRVIEPDPRYNNVLVSKFTNGLMERGKKSLARRIFHDAMDIIDERLPDEEPVVVFVELFAVRLVPVNRCRRSWQLNCSMLIMSGERR